ncbi:MAG TPA: preprotein translocase subunit YajC [Tepidisphaeraceae bacterium]|nr:preprotein translocase subunit YajC [Tepidisphaeraceae bacterium]
MNLLLILAQAATQTAAPTTGGPPPPGWFQLLQGPLFPLMVGVLILYLFVFRSKRQTDKKRTDMLSNLKRGDRVQTIGGILGTVVEARDTDVLLKVDESSNTKIRFSRNAIHRVVEEEKSTEAK